MNGNASASAAFDCLSGFWARWIVKTDESAESEGMLYGCSVDTLGLDILRDGLASKSQDSKSLLCQSFDVDVNSCLEFLSHRNWSLATLVLDTGATRKDPLNRSLGEDVALRRTGLGVDC